MEHNNDFRYDLKLGQLGERHLANILQDEKIEVKTDYRAKETGNVFVEYRSRGKPSGIATSEAKYYAFILSNNNIILISSKTLKEKCRKYIGSKRDVKGGDNNTSSGILLPMKELI